MSNFSQLQAGKARVRVGNSASKNSLLLLIYCVYVSEPGLGQGRVPYRAATAAVAPWSHPKGLILEHFEAIQSSVSSWVSLRCKQPGEGPYLSSPVPLLSLAAAGTD